MKTKGKKEKGKKKRGFIKSIIRDAALLWLVVTPLFVGAQVVHNTKEIPVKIIVSFCMLCYLIYVTFMRDKK